MQRLVPHFSRFGGPFFILVLGATLVLQAVLFFQGADFDDAQEPTAGAGVSPQPRGPPAAGAPAAARAAIAEGAMPRPTPAVPFIFFHIPKCAGSTFEKHFFRSAIGANISILKPCVHTGKPTVYSTIGYDHYPAGFDPDSEPLQCGLNERESCKKGRRAEVIRISIACAGMIIGHFRPAMVNNILCAQRSMRSQGGGLMSTPAYGYTCASAADAFCSCTERLGLQKDRTAMTCAVSIREPLARALSHHYHFDYEKKLDGSRRCDAYKCRKFSDLPIRDQLEVITGTGGNVHLNWLTQESWHTPLRWVGRRIMEWIGDGLMVLKRCAVAIVDRWEDTVALFNAMMPWAEDLGQQDKVIPRANRNMSFVGKAAKKNKSKPTVGFEAEKDQLNRSMPALCEHLAPDVFFYLAAMSLFDHQLRRFNIKPFKKQREEHPCEPIFRQNGVKLTSRITVNMI